MKEDLTPRLISAGINESGYLSRIRWENQKDYRRTLTGIGTGRFLDADTLNMSSIKEPAALTKPFNNPKRPDINVEEKP